MHNTADAFAVMLPPKAERYHSWQAWNAGYYPSMTHHGGLESDLCPEDASRRQLSQRYNWYKDWLARPSTAQDSPVVYTKGMVKDQAERVSPDFRKVHKGHAQRYRLWQHWTNPSYQPPEGLSEGVDSSRSPARRAGRRGGAPYAAERNAYIKPSLSEASLGASVVSRAHHLIHARDRDAQNMGGGSSQPGSQPTSARWQGDGAGRRDHGGGSGLASPSPRSPQWGQGLEPGGFPVTSIRGSRSMKSSDLP